MANSFTVTADVRLNPRSINQSARQVQQALGRITGQASEFQKSLDASTARVFAFGATTVVINSVSQAFTKLVQSTIEVEQRLVEINAIFQQSESVLQNFREAIFAVAQDTGQTFSTVADAAGELARQGLSAEETASRLGSALILTRISGLGAEDSVKTLTAAINGFTSAALTAEQVTSKIVAVDTAFAVSAQDLAQGLARAGSTAEDAGVSFNQLLGLITAVEQRTARGGAVIGNAFKSIFTRLSRGTTIEDLKELGVQIDASQTGVQKLQALSKAIEGISDPTVVSQIKELAGGVFQINVVSAALKDLSSETSVFTRASKEAANASDNALKRNAQLNESLAAQINSLIVGLTNLAEKIGSVTFGPLLENLIGVAGKITEVLNGALSPETGSVIAKGLFKGIGAFLSGPGLVIITSAFLKIVKLVAKFALEGFKAVNQIGSASEKIRQIEGGIVGLLARDENLRKIIASTTATQAQKEQAVIQAIKTENQLLVQQEILLRRIASLAAQKGVTGFSPSGGFKTSGGRFAKGHIPNFARGGDFALEESEAKSLGASPSVKAIKGKGKIGGKNFIMNDQEVEIPNFGRNGDSAVIPKYAKGFIPNFVRTPLPLKNGKIQNVENREYGQKYVTSAFVQKTGDGGLFTKNNNQSGYPFTSGKIKLTHDNLVGGAGPLIRSRYKTWESEVNVKSVDLTQPPFGVNPSILVPQGSTSNIATSTNGTQALKPLNFNFPVRGIKPEKRESLGNNFEKQFDAKTLEKQATQEALNQANNIARVVGKPAVTSKDIANTDAIRGFTGAVRAAAGSIFDASVTTAFKLKASEKGEKGGDFDVRSGGAGLSTLFDGAPVPTSGPFKGLGDFKYSSGAQKSMKKKTLAELRGRKPKLYDELKKEDTKEPRPTDTIQEPPLQKNRTSRAASGYIPNFVIPDLSIPNYAREENPLLQAVKREKEAGLPESRIRVEQSKQLVNKANPTGLAVTNTRDEPNGLKDVLPQKTIKRTASGYIPNYATTGLAPNLAAAAATESASPVDYSELQSKVDKNAKGNDEAAESQKKVASSGNALARVFGLQIGLSLATASISANANKARQDQIKVIGQSSDSEIRAIEGSKKSEAEKAVLIGVIKERAASESAIIEQNRTLGEKTGELINGTAGLLFAFNAVQDLLPKKSPDEGGGSGSTIIGGGGDRGAKAKDLQSQGRAARAKVGKITGGKKIGSNAASAFLKRTKGFGKIAGRGFAAGGKGLLTGVKGAAGFLLKTGPLIGIAIGLAAKGAIEDYFTNRTLKIEAEGFADVQQAGKEFSNRQADRQIENVAGFDTEILTSEQKGQLDAAIANFREFGGEQVQVRNAEGDVTSVEDSDRNKAVTKEFNKLVSLYGKQGAVRKQIIAKEKIIASIQDKIVKNSNTALSNGLTYNQSLIQRGQNEKKIVELQARMAVQYSTASSTLGNISKLLPEGQRALGELITGFGQNNLKTLSLGGAKSQAQNEQFSAGVRVDSKTREIRDLEEKDAKVGGGDKDGKIKEAKSELADLESKFKDAVNERISTEQEFNAQIKSTYVGLVGEFDNFAGQLKEFDVADDIKSIKDQFGQGTLGADALQSKIASIQSTIDTTQLQKSLLKAPERQEANEKLQNETDQIPELKQNAIETAKAYKTLRDKILRAGGGNFNAGLNKVGDAAKGLFVALSAKQSEAQGLLGDVVGASAAAGVVKGAGLKGLGNADGSVRLEAEQQKLLREENAIISQRVKEADAKKTLAAKGTEERKKQISQITDLVKEEREPATQDIGAETSEKIEQIVAGLGGAAALANQWVEKFPELKGLDAAAKKLETALTSAAGSLTPFTEGAKVVSGFVQGASDAVKSQKVAIDGLSAANNDLNKVISTYSNNIGTLSSIVGDLIGQVDQLKQ